MIPSPLKFAGNIFRINTDFFVLFMFCFQNMFHINLFLLLLSLAWLQELANLIFVIDDNEKNNGKDEDIWISLKKLYQLLSHIKIRCFCLLDDNVVRRFSYIFFDWNHILNWGKIFENLDDFFLGFSESFLRQDWGFLFFVFVMVSGSQFVVVMVWFFIHNWRGIQKYLVYILYLECVF